MGQIRIIGLHIKTNTQIMNLFSSLLQEYLLLTFIAVFLTSYIIASSVFPVIIYLSHIKKLTKKPNGRSSHSKAIPTLGGLAIFIGLSISSSLITIVLGDRTEVAELLSVFVTTTILLFVGIKDDLMEISSRKKFFTQLVSALLLIGLTGHYISDFHGLLGINFIPKGLAIIFTTFVYVLVINAYNLIDGIDGLASGLAITIFGFCGFIFITNNHCIDGFISIASIGGLVAFTRYNLSIDRKVFMGDTGSMVIGLLIAYQIISLLSSEHITGINYQTSNMPILALALLSYPMFDTLRVFIIRIKDKKSPLTADRNHIHHKLIDLGLSHIKASLIIILGVILLTITSILIKNLEINHQLIVILFLGITVFSIPNYIKIKT